MHSHRHLATAVAAVGLSVGFVAAGQAADLNRPIYTKAPPPIVSSWTGFYVGGNVGYGWVDPTAVESDTFAVGNAGGPNAFAPTSINLNDSGVVGGAHVGYNYQFATTWVAGIEGDFDFAHIKADNGAGVPLVGNPAAGFFTASPIVGTAVSARATYEDPWSVRGRIGYAQPMYMVYATGGYAQMTVDFSGNVSFLPGAGGAPTLLNSPGTANATRSGWVAGGGVEFKPMPGPWIVGIEYLHYQFDGTNTATAAFVPATFAGNCAPGQQCSKYSLGDVDLNTVRLRLSYKFGG